jgi:pimeloyl-ACP methyl ester carboxylesterase
MRGSEVAGDPVTGCPRARTTLLRSCLAVGAVLVPLALPLPLAAALQRPPQPTFPDLPASAPAGSGVTAPCLEGVEGVVVCGRYRVYEDRDASAGRTLDLAFVVMQASDGARGSAAVTQFNGGPGSPATPGAVGIAARLADIRAIRDILLIDHRGTGSSGALACTVPYPGGVESRFGTVFPLDHAEDCQADLGRRADLSLYTTAIAMDDLAEVATWLGYSGLDLIGGSYGTREAMVFARRHPELALTLVLNGVAPLWEPIYVWHASYLQDALDDLYAECEATPECSGAFPDLREVAAEVFERIGSDPPTVQAEGRTVRFGPGDLAYALRGLLYGAAGRVPALLYAAHEGDWQPLADFYLGRQAWVGDGSIPSGYHFSVLCAEDIDRTSDALVAEATAGTFMGDHLIRGYQGVCDLWPSARLADDHFTPVATDLPTLLLSGERDPVTPPSGAEAVARHLERSLHVVVPNGGHGQGGPCVVSMIRRLIEDASIDDIDTSCVQETPPTPFELSVPGRSGGSR